MVKFLSFCSANWAVCSICVELLTVCVCGHKKVAFNGCEDLEGVAYSTCIGVNSFLHFE
jgi:hypothetical protein